MGRNRQGEQPQDASQAQAQEQAQPLYFELALALAATAGAGGVGNLAPVVLALLNLGFPESEARRVAGIISVDIPVVDGTEGILRMARVEQITYRALFGFQAVGRLVAAEDTERQFERERGYYQLHLSANARREQAAGMTIRAMERWGEIVSWNATIRPSNRPHHRAAHRMNWRPLDGIPNLTQALPGALPFCLCFLGPPVAGAGMLAA